MEHAEEILKDLPKYKLYDKLNKNGDKDSYCKQCSAEKTILSPHKGLFDLCCLFAKNLITLYAVLQDASDENERCRYFTFWIHDNLRKILNTHSKDQGKIYTISSRFSFVLSTIKILLKPNNCSYESRTNINFELWKKWKDLFDYITNYTVIQNQLNSNSTLCPKYLKYMSYIGAVYENYSRECCKGNAMKCHFSFGSNPWCNQGYILPKLTCSETKVLGDSMAGGENEFTRFGKWIHTKMLRAKKFDDNIDEDAKIFLERESSSVDANLYNDDYNVKYYPS
ncbi:PIR Superfamily Protein [Plasmodium ovale curtisi]|uniref:PIR Superfamily Protein n=1 Tax=Plasmodium ovale curtisi TaxID=864141 RepID=A0A1A8WUW4_PLAOA|nr:PIR Superfamily Protein [Plasmodium ovale curtisi]